MTLALYARRKQWPLDGVTVRLKHSRIHAADCADCETKEGKLDQIDSELTLSGTLTDEQRARLFEIAEKCPVHRTLTSEIKIRTRLA
jgi:putative redox protein